MGRNEAPLRMYGLQAKLLALGEQTSLLLKERLLAYPHRAKKFQWF
jgi:hypothetical protein